MTFILQRKHQTTQQKINKNVYYFLICDRIRKNLYYKDSFLLCIKERRFRENKNEKKDEIVNNENTTTEKKKY